MDQLPLEVLLERSDSLQGELVQALNTVQSSDPTAVEALWPLVVIVHEHAASVRMLIEQGMGNSALSLMRVLFDAVVRQTWAGHCATPEQLELLSKNMSPDALQSSLSLPMTSAMLNELEKGAPPALFKALDEFKTYSWKPLNSVIHSGLHALNIARSGLPLHIASQVVKQSNNLLHISAYHVALFEKSIDAQEAMIGIYELFKDCLQVGDPSPDATIGS